MTPIAQTTTWYSAWTSVPMRKYLAAGGLYSLNRNENYVELYNLNDLDAEPRKIMGYKSDIGDIHFTPDGKGFYARDNSGQSIRYSDLTESREVVAVDGKISALELSPDGTKLVGAGVRGTLFIWDVSRQLCRVEDHYSEFFSDLGVLCTRFKGDCRRHYIRTGLHR